MIFHKIPETRPETPLLDSVDRPEQLRNLSSSTLPQLAKELREYLLYSVGQSGGHFGAGLGVVELTIALHYVFNTPEDRLVWDVGHQAYPHKILTERREKMPTIRHQDGLAAFPRRAESEYDTFGVGHSSTSIGAALGMAIAAKQKNEDRKAVAIIGDGAMTAGMAFEAMTHAGDTAADLLVVLNDNDMSISENVGGLSNYLARLLSSKSYNNLRDSSKKILHDMPPVYELAKKTEEHLLKGMATPGTMFEELGFNYIGPIDGHNIELLVETLDNMKSLSGPQFLHIVTKKGKGFSPAEADPIGYHAINKLPNKADRTTSTTVSSPKFSAVFGNWLCDMAASDERLMGITPAMREGSDLIAFSEQYPERYFDVAIAEQHAVTLAAGLACENLKPVVAIYSTFLQRAYDQLIHDVAIQDLDVLFAIDRAGLVGEDGPTHAGSFDLAYLRCIPGMVIMAPSDENETRLMLSTGYQYEGPAAVRYPRGTGPGAEITQELSGIEIGKGRIVKDGQKVAILAFGTLLHQAKLIAEKHNFTLIDMRFVKPLDEALILDAIEKHELLVTIEENSIMGGAGSAVNEFINSQYLQTRIINLGLPDYYVEHAKPTAMHKECGLDAEGIEKSIFNAIKGFNL
jgi:1-deoxy-D-xylulose-5-phosphate synthase